MVFGSYYLAELPTDLAQAAFAALFCGFLLKFMLERLDRIKVKYGLLDSSETGLKLRKRFRPKWASILSKLKEKAALARDTSKRETTFTNVVSRF